MCSMLHSLLQPLSLLLLSWLCCMISALNEYTSNSTHWRSLSDFEPSQNTSYGSLVLHHALRMQFSFIFHGKTVSNQWENVFRIGGSSPPFDCSGQGMRFPSMFVLPETGNLDQVNFPISKGGDNGCWDAGIPAGRIHKSQRYHVVLEFNRTWRSVTMHNGTHVQLEYHESVTALDSSLFYSTLTVWMSEDSTVSANVTLSDISIITWDPITSAPTSEPTSTPTISPSTNPTISTIPPTATPTNTPSLTPTLIPSLTPTDHPTDNPTVTPTNHPTVTLSVTPTATPSLHPSDTPTNTPSLQPSENATDAPSSTTSTSSTSIVIYPPTHSPTDEAKVPETTGLTAPLSSTLDVGKKGNADENGVSSLSKTETMIYLVMVPILGFGCVLCVFLFYFWRKWRVENKRSGLSPHSRSRISPTSHNGTAVPLRDKDSSSGKNVSGSSQDDDGKELEVHADSGIFDKIYNQQILINIEQQRAANNRPDMSSKDVLIPHEESWSGESEQMYIAQRHSSTTRNPPQDVSEMELTLEPTSLRLQRSGHVASAFLMNINENEDMEQKQQQQRDSLYDTQVRKKSSYSSIPPKFANVGNHAIIRKKSSIGSGSQQAHDLALQHQVTIAISDRHGLKLRTDSRDSTQLAYPAGDYAPDHYAQHDEHEAQLQQHDEHIHGQEGYDEQQHTIVAIGSAVQVEQAAGDHDLNQSSDSSIMHGIEEQETIDVYHGAAPSSEPAQSAYQVRKLSSVHTINSDNDSVMQSIPSLPPPRAQPVRSGLSALCEVRTPEHELYGKGSDLGVSKGAPSHDQDNVIDDDDSDSDAMYGKGTDSLVSPGDKYSNVGNLHPSMRDSQNSSVQLQYSNAGNRGHAPHAHPHQLQHQNHDELQVDMHSNSQHAQNEEVQSESVDPENVVYDKYYKRPPVHRFNKFRDDEGCGDYEWIEQHLKLCDDEWMKYLRNFKENKVSDNRLNQLSESDWIQLIPKIGPRNEFKMMWMQYERQRAQSLHL